MLKLPNKQYAVRYFFLVPALVILTSLPVLSKTAVPVFLLAGQSNMSGYASANDLTADQKTSVENVKIYVDMTWENNGKLKEWMTLGPGFGSFSNNIGPELSLGRTLSEKLPDTKIAIVKVCCGSTYLGNYASKPDDCWIPPSSSNGNAGPHYKRMLSAVDDAFKAFNSAYDTSEYVPMWAGFVWHQGEFDGQEKNLADAYETNLTCLINDIRKDLNVTDLPAIIAMIDVQGSWQFNSIIRAAEIAVTKNLNNVDTLDTKGFPTDGVHYKAQGQVKMGTIAAERWLDMEFVYDPTVKICQFNNMTSKHPRITIQSGWSNLIDLSGRKFAPSQGKALQSILSSSNIYISTKNGHGTGGLKMIKLYK